MIVTEITVGITVEHNSTTKFKNKTIKFCPNDNY